jgi:hypothetical protein
LELQHRAQRFDNAAEGKISHFVTSGAALVYRIGLFSIRC